MSLRSDCVGQSCKDCADRYVGCHSKCEKYQEASKKWEKVKADIKKNHVADSNYWSMHVDHLIKNKKGKRYYGK